MYMRHMYIYIYICIYTYHIYIYMYSALRGPLAPPTTRLPNGETRACRGPDPEDLEAAAYEAKGAETHPSPDRKCRRLW